MPFILELAIVVSGMSVFIMGIYFLLDTIKINKRTARMLERLNAPSD